MKKSEATPLLTTEDVARRLQCTTETVRKLIQRGHLHATGLVRRYRITEHALQAFLATRGLHPRRRSARKAS